MVGQVSQERGRRVVPRQQEAVVDGQRWRFDRRDLDRGRAAGRDDGSRAEDDGDPRGPS
jgi:hypothetical protein